MTGIPFQTRVYVSILTLVFAVAAAWSYSSGGLDSRTGEDLLIGLIIAVMIGLVEWYQVQLPARLGHFSFSVGSILSLGVALTLNPLAAAVVVIIAGGIVDSMNRIGPIKIVANAANLGLATLLASASYWALAGSTPTPLDSTRAFLATIVAAVVYTLLNLGAMSIIIAPVVGESPISMWRSNFSALFVLVSLPMLGALVPVVANTKPMGLVILAVPLAVTHFALRTLRNVELQTQATIISLSDALEHRDVYTSHHSARVTEFVESILDELPGLPSRVRLITIEAARIHDVGKVGIKDTALLKAGPLTEEERSEMQRHSAIGADIVGNLEMYRQGANIVRHHHERWDGKGYPDGLKGEDIPIGARIIAVADSFDAMTSDRPYRRALSFTTALNEITRNAGTQFDPQIVEAFERAMTKPYPNRVPEASPLSAPAD